MKIRLVEIPEGGLEIREEISEEWLVKALELAEYANFTPCGKGVLSLHVRKLKRQIQLSGKISVKVSFTCSRCGNDCVLEASPKIKELFLPADKFATSGGKKLDLRKEDFQYILYEGDEIDLERYMAETVILALPTYPRCENSELCIEKDVAYEEDWVEETKPDVNPDWREGIIRVKNDLKFDD